MFQHRLFGADKPPLFDVLPQITTSFNAFTGTDSTHYLLQGRKDELQSFLRLEAARMAADCRHIPAAEFEREREVVRNELRQNFGQPEAQIWRMIHREAFPKGHPYHHLGIGDDEQLAAISQTDVCQFLDQYYVPQNATLIVAGNVEPNQVKTEASYAFGAIRKGLAADGAPRPVPRRPVAIPQLSHRKVEFELPVERPSVHIVWALPPRYSKRGQYAGALHAAGSILDGFNSDWNFAAETSADSFGGAQAPLFALSMVLPNLKKLDDALEFAWKAASLAHRPFEPGDDTEAKNRQIGGFIAQFEDLTARTTQVAELVQFRHDFRWDSADTFVYDEFERIRHQDTSDVRSFVKTTLKRSKALVIVVKPNPNASAFKKASLRFEAKGRSELSEPVVDPAEAKRPLAIPAGESALGQAQRFFLGNGMKVVLLPEGSKMPVVSVALVFKAGAAHEPAGHEGLAEAAARILDHPPGSAIHLIGARWSAEVNADTTTFSAHGINLYTKELIVGLERLIKIGQYDQEVIERVRRQARAVLESRQFRQRLAFAREAAMAVWGPDHPYAIKGTPTSASLGQISRDATSSFRDRHYTAANATLIVAGNFDAAVAEAAIRNSFGDWDGGRHDRPIAAAAVRSEVRVVGIIGDELPHVDIAIQYPGAAGVDGQHAARLVLAEMLDLQMGRIRTELGSTYGIQATRETLLGPSRYLIAGSVQAERAGETLRVMRHKLDQLRAGDEFDRVFAQARRAVLKNLLAESTVSQALARKLARIAIYNQTADFYAKLTRHVASLSPAHVRAVMQHELNPEREVIAVLGDKQALETTLAEAGISEVKYVDVSQ
jgi:zinc protease